MEKFYRYLQNLKMDVSTANGSYNLFNTINEQIQNIAQNKDTL